MTIEKKRQKSLISIDFIYELLIMSFQSNVNDAKQTKNRSEQKEIKKIEKFSSN